MDFNEIYRKIKNLEIQGAENVARYGIKALMIRHDKNSVKKILSLRSTEPLLKNAIRFSISNPEVLGQIALKHFDDAEAEIARLGSRLVKSGFKVFTHCHSSTVVNILKEAKKTKKFDGFNTETRPLLQGRKTATELNKLGIKVNHMVDSMAEYGIRNSDIMLIGADSITDKYAINKVGSAMLVKLAGDYGLPVYVCADSWKYDNKETKIEERPAEEVWKNAPRGVTVINYAFDKIEERLIRKIVSEIGIYEHEDFIKSVKKHYPWIQGRGD